jgi:hypothetical protein
MRSARPAGWCITLRKQSEHTLDPGLDQTPSRDRPRRPLTLSGLRDFHFPSAFWKGEFHTLLPLIFTWFKYRLLQIAESAR